MFTLHICRFKNWTLGAGNHAGYCPYVDKELAIKKKALPVLTFGRFRD
jgi:hypothetical protein